MEKTKLKVVIPMAGLGTRLRPHTWSKPKQLVSVAGKTVLDHVLDSLSTLPESYDIELINIVGYLGGQIEEYVSTNYPEYESHTVVQDNPLGQSHAIQLSSEYLTGQMLVVFADTLIESDLSFLNEETADGIAFVKPIPDPRRFGVAEIDQEGYITQLIEKPADMNNNLAVVGFYYFKDAQELLSAIDEQMNRKIQLKGEYYLVDAINILLERGLKMRTEKVGLWLDAGTPEALLKTNQYLLEHGRDNSVLSEERENIVVIPPVFIHPNAKVSHSIIGPYVSIGSGCRVERSIIKDSILEDEARTEGVILEESLVGRRAYLTRHAGKINAGDDTIVTL
ncbi:MAG: sugar phosphate nucleotidyltransferase [Chloroflexota bacterium]|nr:sugar phosphate nucleotidyltransferase [Chloroflexota bacterium]